MNEVISQFFTDGVLSLASTSLTPPSMLSPFIPITVEKLAMEPGKSKRMDYLMDEEEKKIN